MDYSTGALDSARSSFSYLRMGNPSTNEKVEFTGDDTKPTPEESNIDIQKTGWFDYTTGNRTTVTEGDKLEVINGKHTIKVNKKGYDAYIMHQETRDCGGFLGWRKSTVEWVNSDTYSVGSKDSYFAGVSTSINAALVYSTTLAGQSSFSAGVNFASNYDVGFKVGYSHEFSWVEGSKYVISNTSTTQANESINIYVESEPTPNPNNWFLEHKKTCAALATLSTCAAPISNSLLDNNWVGLGIKGASFAASAYMINAAYKTLANRTKKPVQSREAQIALDKEGIVALCGAQNNKTQTQFVLDKDGGIYMGNKIDKQGGKGKEIEWWGDDRNGKKGEGAFFTMSPKSDVIIAAGKKAGVQINSKENEKQHLKLFKDGNVELSSAGDMRFTNGKTKIKLKDGKMTIDAKEVKFTAKAKIGKGGELTVG